MKATWSQTREKEEKWWWTTMSKYLHQKGVLELWHLSTHKRERVEDVVDVDDYNDDYYDMNVDAGRQ